MTDNRNTILAVILSGLVLIGWQYFYNVPQMEKQRAPSRRRAELVKPTPQADAAARHAAGRTAPRHRPMRRRPCSRAADGAGRQPR